MTKSLRLTGIAWDHSRAFPPLVATAQRFEEIHPGIRVDWRKRNLDEFGHAPIDELAARFDLIVIDHPWAGYCFARDLTYDLSPLVPARVLDDLKRNSIGSTFASYVWENKLLALPIDAATPCPSWRPDLLGRAGVEPPQTWPEAVKLAERKLAIIPGFDADLFLHFLMILKGVGAELFSDPDKIASTEQMEHALGLLKELTSPMPAEIFNMNPIQVAERMTRTDDFAWNAFGYTYNNYARPGYADKQLMFGDLLSLVAAGPRLRSVLGGTGIAVSRHCAHPEAALEYAAFVASGAIQKSIYLLAGGQPSHLSAWNEPEADVLCGGFFRGTRAAQEEAFARPRYDGYVPLQRSGGRVLQEILRDGLDAEVGMEKLNDLCRQSQLTALPEFQIN